MLPRKLAISPHSPNYNKDALDRVDQVHVDGVHIPRCVAYDMDAGWAFGMDEKRNWLPRVYGVVTVTEKKTNG